MTHLVQGQRFILQPALARTGKPATAPHGRILLQLCTVPAFEELPATAGQQWRLSFENFGMVSFKLTSQRARYWEFPGPGIRAARSAFMIGLPLAPQITVMRFENNVDWSRTCLNFKIFSYDKVDRGAIPFYGEIFRHLRVKATVIAHR